MKRILYKLYLKRIYFFRQLYKDSTPDKSSHAAFTSSFFIFINLHSLLIILECGLGYNIGIGSFWTPTNTPKSSIGYLIGGALGGLYFVIVYSLKKNISKIENVNICREVILKKKKKVYPVLVVIATVSLFVGSLVLLINTIIPEGGL